MLNFDSFLEAISKPNQCRHGDAHYIAPSASFRGSRMLQALRISGFLHEAVLQMVFECLAAMGHFAGNRLASRFPDITPVENRKH